MKKSNINKQLIDALIKILLGNLDVLNDKLRELAKNEDRKEIEKYLVNIYKNLEAYSSELGLTLQEKITIEEKKLEVLKNIKENRKWIDLTNVFSVCFSFVVAGAIFYVCNNSNGNDESNEIDNERKLVA